MTATAERTLSDAHLAMLQASAISDEVALARGYWTATKSVELERLGYRRGTVGPPALVLPLHDVAGEVVGYQVRPDTPPTIDGKLAKYLSPPGAETRLDIPPTCRSLIGQRSVALWVTEGARKADSLASHGATAIAVLGVQMFRTSDWDHVPLDGRQVYVCFDSDVMVKPQVHAALSQLGAYLTERDARPLYVYLPTDNGKVGADDYLAAGHTLDELCRLAESELRPAPAEKPKRAAALPTAILLNSVRKLFRRFVRFPTDHEPAALALWTLHTWAFSAAASTPYVLVVSPEKRSGKTRALEIAELVARAPVRAANISAAGVFQAIEKWTPTLLVDELDATFRATSEQAEALRSVLNAGNRRGSHVIRGSQDGEPQRFSTFCAKALAGINTGKLPDTIRDRSIVIAMQRRRPDELVDDLFPDELADQLAELRTCLEDWAAENTEQLAVWRRSKRVTGLDDRLQEAWDPLLAIAHLAQAGWPEEARQAATALAKGAEDASEAAHGHVLIEALRSIFERWLTLPSKTICEKLNDDEELPFGGYSDGAGIKPRTLAKLLKPYDIKPKAVWVDEKTLRGYERDQFTEAWQRYARDGDASGEAQEAQGPQEPNADGDLDLADLADLADSRGGCRAHIYPGSENGGPPKRDPRLAVLDGETYEQWNARVEGLFNATAGQA